MVIFTPPRNFWKIGAEKIAEMAKNSIFWPKTGYFWPFLYVRQCQIATSGEYCYFLMTGEFLWNSDQRKWVKMAKNSIFWHKKLRQIQAVQNLAQRPLLPFFGVQLGRPYKNPASVYFFFNLRYFQERYPTERSCPCLRTQLRQSWLSCVRPCF